MVVLGFTLFLFMIAAGCLYLAWRRRDGSMEAAVKEAALDFWHLLPRLAVGVIGAGFIARAMPQDTVAAWLGPASGLQGVSLAALAGALTPGGPVVGFAVGAAALKAGAGLPQVMAFVTGWALYTINRVLVWEVHTMPRRFILLRLLVSLPFPFMAAGLMWWMGRVGGAS
jgi:uncharacterized membrane protein YraQ (UPF0718 family)